MNTICDKNKVFSISMMGRLELKRNFFYNFDKFV